MGTEGNKQTSKTESHYLVVHKPGIHKLKNNNTWPKSLLEGLE